jgi:hypothetical protein
MDTRIEVLAATLRLNTRLMQNCMTDPFHHLLAAASSIDEVEEFPKVADIMREWSEVSERMLSALDVLDAEALAGPPPFQFPIEDPTLLGGLTFLVQHDTYHIGQLALLRKHWRLGAMSYD